MTRTPARAMSDFLDRRILVVTGDPDAARGLREAASRLGAQVEVATEVPGTTAAAWDLVCLDEEVAGAAGWLASGNGAGRRPSLLWITPESRGRSALAALEAGADDVLPKPVWLPEARARLAGQLERARLRRKDSDAQVEAYASQLRASHENLQELYDELELQALDLQHLLSAQEALIPLLAPARIRETVTAALARLFPGAAVEARVLRRDEEPVPGPARRVDRDPGDQGWVGAVVPLSLGAETLGFVSVRAPAGQVYRQGKLDLLEVYAAQASQALHRSRLYLALSEGKAEWERTFDTIADAISIVGPDFRLRRVNRALAATLGRQPRELVGAFCHRVLRGRDEPCPRCPVSEALETGEVVHREGERVGGANTYDYHAYPLRDEAGRVYAALAYARDVTREEQLTRSLRQSEKLMTLGQIAAGIAHEINNPLTAISSYAQLLSLRAEDGRMAESARRIQQGIDRINRLVGNLMSFVRPSDENFYPLGVNEIVADALSFSRYEITRGETELVEDLREPLPRVLGSKEQLEHVLVNLLTNARDAVAGRGRITVTTAARGDTVVLEVADDGVGIAPGDLDKVFEPFYTTKPVGKGTGLGLFIAAGITRKHGGNLAVRSEPGRGTQVSLTLPAFSA